MGKAYANRKIIEERPKDDFYQTPLCCCIELLNTGILDEYKDKKVLDPCCGKYAISNFLTKNGFNVTARDIMYGQEFLNADYSNEHYDITVMNPPFKDFDSFVKKALEVSDVVCAIGKPNFLGAHNRNINGFWKHLKYMYVFDRMIAYDKEWREDGKVQCGMLVSAWMIWDKSYDGEPVIRFLDMQKYILKAKEIK